MDYEAQDSDDILDVETIDIHSSNAIKDLNTKEKNKLFNAIVMVEKLPKQVLKKSFRNKENINPEIESTESDRNNIKDFYTRFCKNCKVIAKNKRVSCCLKCKGVLVYECYKCGKNVTSYGGILHHLKSTCLSQGHYYQCHGCPYKSASRRFVVNHIKIMHKNLSVSDIKIIASQDLQKDLKNSERYVHKCFECGKQFCQLNYLKKHSKACGDFKYQVVSIGADDVENGSHENSDSEGLSHNPTPDILNVIKLAKHYCKKCDDRTAIYDNVYSSKKCNSCKSTLLFECSKCKKQYESANGIVVHMKIKCASQQMYVCSKCNYQGLSKRYLTIHYKNVHESTSVECDNCKKILKNKGTLVCHLKYCGKEPSSVCASCPKCRRKYKTEFSMKVHLKYCRKKPSFFCTMCVHKSHRKYDLRKHMISMHFKNVDKYPDCPKCGEQFKNKQSANVHSRHCGISAPHSQRDYCPKHNEKTRLRSHTTRSQVKSFDKSDESDVDVVN